MGIAKAGGEAQQVDCRCEMGDVRHGLGMGHRAWGTGLRAEVIEGRQKA